MRRVLLAVLALSLASPTWAQNRPAVTPARPAPAKPEPPPPPDVPPPYEPQLLHLGELMGTLSFLRDLCGDGDGAAWRARMQSLIGAEAANNAALRDRMAGAFNRGFRDYARIYRECTDNARAASGRALEEGSRLSRDVESRFGG